MSFQGLQVTKSFVQNNQGTPEQVFPLLCPIREKDWLDGWDCKLIHSKSGVAELDCVFTTQSGDVETVWQITRYQPSRTLEFVRVSPGQNVVKIIIRLEPRDQDQTLAHISYQYTALNETQNKYIENHLEQEFQSNMQWWEKALNHYLVTGEKLLRP